MSDKVITDADQTDSNAKKTVFSRSFTLGKFSGWLSFYIPILYLLLYLIEGSSYIWRPISIFLYMAFVVLAFFLLLGITITKKDEINEPGINLALALGGAIAVLASFSQISRHLYLSFGGFVADKTGYWHWLRFGFANLLEGVLFDIPAIYDWKISEIKATDFWSRTVLFLFRTSLEFLVIVAVWHNIKIVRQNWGKPKLSKSKNYFAFIFPGIGHWLLIALWGIPIAVSVGAIVNDVLSFKSSWSAIRFCTPVAFGVWLAWQSLRALGLPRWWNKLFALAGIIGGSWIVRESWPAFRAFLG